jgi:hypothetical protein
VFRAGSDPRDLREVPDVLSLAAQTWTRREGRVIACFDLPKGESRLSFV